MSTVNQKQAARQFVDRWKNEKGNEEEQSRSFWIELLQNVLGVDDPTHVLEFERKVKGRKIDVFYEDMGVLMEQKSRGIDLDKKSERSKKAGEETPYQQAKWYADNLPFSVRPRWIVVSNFDEFRIHDLDTEDPETDYVSVVLAELPDQLHLFGFLTDKSASRLVKEQELSVKAGEIVGRLYKSLAVQYKNIETDEDEQRSLNILIVRFVFLLYAEDAGILQEHQAFLKYMKGIEPEKFRNALRELFEVLDTPEDERDPYLDPDLAAFPYINGSLFSEQGIIIPQFTAQIKYDLLKEASQDFDWSGISPTIFGAAFESTLNPETRREGGMHYTSIENIHKVIDPLFLDDLKAELAAIEGEKVEKRRILLLKQFQQKLASIKILDPACGSGNFLTESYLSLRKLENRVLESLLGQQMGIGFDGDTNPIKVSIDQFYGIEINDFAVAVAKTALWIAEEQMMDVTQEILLTPLNFLPLTSNDNIHEGNALRMDWNEVIPAPKCDFIVGNPPFLGHQDMSTAQHEDLDIVLSDCNKHGKLDYVAGWYGKALQYIEGYPISCAFVSTNSICQGEQVSILWDYLFDKGAIINFAYHSFIWNNEASDQAHVHCVIVGFDAKGKSEKKLFTETGFEIVDEINGYLFCGPKKSVASRSKNVNKELAGKKLAKGSQPTDGGFLLFKPEEGESFIRKYPDQAKFIKKFIGADEFINGKYRYCLWLVGADPVEYEANPEIRERLNSVREMRLASPTASVRKDADTPQLFTQIRQPDTKYLLFPRHSSGRRRYLPIGFVDPSVIAGDAASYIADADLYLFGVLSSEFHNAWMRTVCGRLKSDYRYTPAVYNSFVFPDASADQREEIERKAQSVLDARSAYPESSLADLYDPDKMPLDLLEAHKALDRAVEEAYGVDFDGNEEKIVAHLFELYAKATEGE